MPKMMKQKVLQLAGKLVRYGFTKNSPYVANYTLPPGSIYYIATLNIPTRGALKCYGPVACKLNICLYAPLIIGVWYLSIFCSSNAGLMI